METITLFYLALGVAFMLLIIVAVLFKSNNNLKKYFNNLHKLNKQLVSDKTRLEIRLGQYEKTNVEQIKKINELDEEINKYLTQLTEYKESECRALNNNERLKAENKRLYLKVDEYDLKIDAYATKISEYELENIKIKEECENEILDSATKLVDLEMNNIKLQANLDDQTDFILSLNERLQKAEAEAEKYFNKFHEQREDNRLLADERDELLSKLSRKGTGVKGSKKKEFVFNNESYGSQITEVEFEEQKYVEITSTKQLEQYVGCKFECVLAQEDEFITFSGKLISNGNVFILAFNGTTGWGLSKLEKKLADNVYNKGWGVFDYDFGDTIKSLKILL